jgi:hypothetical protein
MKIAKQAAPGVSSRMDAVAVAPLITVPRPGVLANR